MAIQENKVKKTPQQLKLKRAKDIKMLAKEVFKSLLPISLTNVSIPIKTAVENGDRERERSIRKDACQRAAESSILAATTFYETWKKKKGEFLHDDV